MTSRNTDGREDYREKKNWMLEEPTWDLENLQDIEKKFNEYSEEYNQVISDKTVYQKRRQAKIQIVPKAINNNNKNHQYSVNHDKIKEDLHAFCQNFQSQLQNQENDSPRSMHSSGAHFRRQFTKRTKPKNQLKRQKSHESSINSSRNSIDSALMEKIKDVTERLQHKSYKQYKSHQESKNKKPPNFAEEYQKEEKINKSVHWQNIHDQIKDEFINHTAAEQTHNKQQNLSRQQTLQQQQAKKKKQSEDNVKVRSRQHTIVNKHSHHQKGVEMVLDQVNPATDLLGNHAVSVLFQALLVNQMKDTFGLNLNMDSGIPISQKVFDAFGIQHSFLTSLKSEGERRQYIIKTMNARIDMLMRDWNNEVKQREKKVELENKQKKNQQDKQEEEDQDYFEWLDLKSQHNSLRKKLRALVIQKMNEYSNQSKLLQVYKQNQIKNRQQIDPKHVQKLVLEGIDFISTKTLIGRMKPSEGILLDKINNKHKKEKPAKLSQNFLTEADEQQSIEEDTNFRSSVNDFDSRKNSSVIEWNDNLETQYQQNRKTAKGVYFGDIPTSNWSELGYLPLVQQVNLDSKKQISRDNMLNKYANGEQLTAQELKFIADTSQLLNQCLDKNFLQQSLKNISQESLHYLELNLAEQIIQNYEDMKKTIIEARTEYVKTKVRNLKKENREASKIAQKLQKKQEYIQWHRKQAHLMSHELKRVESKRPILFKYQTNFFLRMFVNIIKEKVKEFRRKKDLENEELKKQGIPVGDYKFEQNFLVSALEKREKQQIAMHKLSQQKVIEENSKKKMATIHRIHPPSKLPLFPKNEENESDIQKFDRLKDRYEYMDKKIEEFKLGTRSHTEARVSQNFASYYSNGPLVGKPSKIQQNQNYKPMQQEELEKIEKLQKTFKKYKMRNVVNKMKERHYSQGIREHYESLNVLYKAKFIANHACINNNSKLEQTSQQLNKSRQSLQSSKSVKSYVSSSHQSSTQKKIDKYQTEISKIRRESKKHSIVIQEGNNNAVKSHFSRSNVKFHTNINNVSTSTVFNNDRFQTQESQDRLLTDQDTQGYYTQKTASPGSRSLAKYSNIKENTQWDIKDSIEGQSDLDMSKTSTQNLFTPVNKQRQQQQYTGKHSAKSHRIRPQTSKTLALERKLEDLMYEQEYRFKAAINPKKQEFNFGNTGFMLSQMKIKYQTLLNAAKRKQFSLIQNGKYEFTKNDLRQLDPIGCSALYYAVQNNDIDFVEWILKKGGDPNQRCMNDVTPLHIAFQKDHIECIGLMIQNGGDLNILSAEGYTPPGMAKEATLKLLNLEDAVIVSKSKDMFGQQGEYFDNNSLLQKSPKNELKDERVKLSNFFPLQKNNVRIEENPTIGKSEYTSM